MKPGCCHLSAKILVIEITLPRSVDGDQQVVLWEIKEVEETRRSLRTEEWWRRRSKKLTILWKKKFHETLSEFESDICQQKKKNSAQRRYLDSSIFGFSCHCTMAWYSLEAKSHSSSRSCNTTDPCRDTGSTLSFLVDFSFIFKFWVFHIRFGGRYFQ